MQIAEIYDRRRRRTQQVKLHDAREFDGMRRAGHLAAATLDFVGPHVRPGATIRSIAPRARAAIPDGTVTWCRSSFSESRTPVMVIAFM
jgi:methionine aminopeptidase